MSDYRMLTPHDLEALNLPDDELRRIDEGILELLEAADRNTEQNRACCKVSSCSCSGYGQGIPSTTCRHCGHEWNQHRC